MTIEHHQVVKLISSSSKKMGIMKVGKRVMNYDQMFQPSVFERQILQQSAKRDISSQ